VGLAWQSGLRSSLCASFLLLWEQELTIYFGVAIDQGGPQLQQAVSPKAAVAAPAEMNVEVLGDRVRCDIRYRELKIPPGEYQAFKHKCMVETAKDLDGRSRFLCSDGSPNRSNSRQPGQRQGDRLRGSSDSNSQMSFLKISACREPIPRMSATTFSPCRTP
jgi:hypothetical protein